MGRRYDQAGSDQGRAILIDLAARPQTARRLCAKIAAHFVSDSPDPKLAARLEAAWRRSGGDLAQVALALVQAPQAWAPPPMKLKTPYEDVVSTMRVLGVKLLPGTVDAETRRKGLQAVYWQLTDLRNAPLAWDPPNGYPDVATSWQAADTALGRWNTHQSLAAAWWPNRQMLSIPQSRALLPATLPTTYGALVDALSDRLLFRTKQAVNEAA